jgi:ferrochelatase
MSRPFDAVLLVSFGGPLGPADVRPFLHNVLRGRRVPAHRIEEVARHYDLFGGVSPLTDLTFRQARGLEARLPGRGLPLPVFVGMRNWHPFIEDTLRAMRARGVRRAVGVIAAAHRGYSGCGQYRQNVLRARAELVQAGLGDVQVTYVGDWHTSPGFIAAVTAHVREAYTRLPPALRDAARLVFTAHSVPASMPGCDRYVAQLRESAGLVAAAIGAADWTLVFQSRSGRPEDPWLEPDVKDYLREAGAAGLKAAVLCPIGFVCDHIEVLYDLDIEARQVAEAAGVAVSRASAANDHPRFLDALADAVVATWERYRTGLPLTLVDADHPDPQELPPPCRTAAAAAEDASGAEALA